MMGDGHDQPTRRAWLGLAALTAGVAIVAVASVDRQCSCRQRSRVCGDDLMRPTRIARSNAAAYRSREPDPGDLSA
jgi:hypothetical protein